MKNVIKDYLKKGFTIVPLFGIKDNICTCRRGAQCSNSGKHPIPNRNGKFLIKTEADWAKMRNSRNKHHNPNIAFATGNDFNIIVIDLDVKPEQGIDGIESFYKMVENFAPGYTVPSTPTAKSGGSGKHIYFALPPSGVAIKSGVNIFGHLGFPGIDIRGEGGLIVAPPSTHHSGNPYSWEDELSPNDVEFTPFPEFLMELLN